MQLFLWNFQSMGLFCGHAIHKTFTCQTLRSGNYWRCLISIARLNVQNSGHHARFSISAGDCIVSKKMRNKPASTFLYNNFTSKQLQVLSKEPTGTVYMQNQAQSHSRVEDGIGNYFFNKITFYTYVSFSSVTIYLLQIKI